ncbi:PLP-dependent aminotransferase family protein [Streptomyces sp. NPDC002701]|uniref:aminotransferase-like domain-containing protein n=1 Tax=Streptomyces sp. NPDC002701 TaxID=3364661 RepID=UPI0036AF5258
MSTSMTLLSEVAQRYPDAISFASGRPYAGFFDLDAIHRYMETFRRHLLCRLGGDEAAVRSVILQYGRTKGIIHDLIAEHLRIDEGIEADPESIVVTVGCQEALQLTLTALRAGPEDVVLAVAPTYVGVHGAAQLADMDLLTVRDSPEGIDLDDLRAVTTRAKARGLRPRALYLVPDFANPSGVSMSRTTRERVLRIAEEQDLLILEDNPYGFFGSGEPGPPTLKAMDRFEQVVLLGSFAKTGIPGARVGYAVAGQPVRVPGGPPRLLADGLAALKSMVTVNTSPIAQAVIGGKLLEHGYSLRAANAREICVYQRNLQLMRDGLAAHFQGAPEVSWNSPAGGFFLLLDVPFDADDDMLDISASQYGVLWTPLHHFYADSLPRRRLRLSFSHLEPAEMAEGLDRLAAFVRAGSAP